MRHLRACGSVILGLMAILTLSVVPAHAATLLVASDPRPKQELSQAPGWVTLVFKRDVDRSVAKILVTNSKGANVTVNALIVEGNNVTTQLRDGLPKDTYTVHYRIDRADGQPEGGAFQFAYGNGRWTSLPDASWSGSAEEPELMSNPNPNVATPPPAEEPTEVRPPLEVEQADGATVIPEVPTPTPTPVVSDGVTITPIPAESTPAETAPPEGGQAGSWWPWLGGLVLLGAAGTGAWVVFKRRQG